MLALSGLMCAAAPSVAASGQPSPPYLAEAPEGGEQSTRSYAILPHDGREPSDEYRREMENHAGNWLAALGSDPWRITFTDLASELVENPHTPLPQYLRVPGDGFELTIGFDDEIHGGLTAEEVQSRINFVATSGFPIEEIETEDWRFEASVPSTHIDKGIRVTRFGDGAMTLQIDLGFFAVYGRDRRVVAGVPEVILPEFGYFQKRRAFAGEIKLEMSIDAFIQAPPTKDHPTWREVQHEAWGRAHAPSVLELMSVYSGDHLASAKGQPAITSRAHRTTQVAAELSDQHMVSATISLFELADDSVEAQRWSGLARLHEGKWQLERLYFSQRCRRGPEKGRWTSAPCE